MGNNLPTVAYTLSDCAILWLVISLYVNECYISHNIIGNDLSTIGYFYW